MNRLDLSVMCQNQNKESWDIEVHWLKWINNIILIVRSLPKYIILNLCYPLYLRWDSSITIHLGTNQLGCNQFTPKESKKLLWRLSFFFNRFHFSLVFSALPCTFARYNWTLTLLRNYQQTWHLEVTRDT